MNGGSDRCGFPWKVAFLCAACMRHQLHSHPTHCWKLAADDDDDTTHSKSPLREGPQVFGSATFSALQRRWHNQFRRANWSIGRCRRRCLVFHIAHSSFRGPSVGEWNVLPFKAMYDLLLEQSTWKVGDDRFCSCMEAVFEVIDSAR